MEGFDYQYFWSLFGIAPFWLTQIIVFIALTYACPSQTFFMASRIIVALVSRNFS